MTPHGKQIYFQTDIPLMITEKQFNTGEVTLNYAEGPSNGAPLLLLHGTGNRWQAFNRYIPGLVGRWHVYALDFRGHGGSGRAPQYGFGFYTGDVVEFMENVIGEPAVVFGHSLGGRVALKVAAEHPEATRAVILGDSSLTEPEPAARMGAMFGGLAELVERYSGVHELFEALMERAGEGADPVMVLGRAGNLSMVDPCMLRSIADHIMDLESPFNHFHGYSPEELLPKVRCPVLILQAERGMLRDVDVEKALEVLPEAIHVKLRDVPHEFLMYDPEPVLRAVTVFLETL